MIKGNMQKITLGMAMTVTIARYLPNTTYGRLTGAVSSSWSVLFLRSSEKLLIVISGIPTRNTIRDPDNVYEKYGYPDIILYAMK